MNTETMIKALRILAQDIQSDDGFANACIADAADMIEALRAENEGLKQLCKSCADYLDISELTSIAHGSIYHKELRQAAKGE